MNRRKFLRTVGPALLTSGMLKPSLGMAEAYPSRPVRIVVPGSAGGVLDVVARRLTYPIGKRLGQQVLVENKPGANGIIGAESVAKAKPDGYTVLTGSTTSISIIRLLYSSLPYDPDRDFTPLTLGGFGYPVLVVGNTLRVKTLRELLAYSRARPGAVTCGTPGMATPNFLGAKLLEKLTGITFNHVTYKNQPEIITDMIGGQVDVTVDFAPIVVPHIQAGRIRGLVVAGPVRKPAIADVPTAPEAGLPDFEVLGWNGYFVPARTQPDIVRALHQAFSEAIRGQQIRRVCPQPRFRTGREYTGGIQGVHRAPEQALGKRSTRDGNQDRIGRVLLT
jgi:tripartite-type tricarboxylate transporter receptor subunit TctC